MLSVWPNYTSLVWDVCVHVCMHLWVYSCMAICGPLESESNMFKISIKLILDVHSQINGLACSLKACCTRSVQTTVCVCVCVCQHISMFVVRFMFVCVLSGWCFMCERGERGKWLLYPGPYRGYRAYLFHVFPSHRLVSCHWSQQPHLLFPLSPDRQTVTRASRKGWRWWRREGGRKEKRRVKASVCSLLCQQRHRVLQRATS